MVTEQIYVKTPLGIEEIQTRKLQLAPRLRTMLIMIDGKKTASMLVEDAAKFGCPADFLDSLEMAGLIAKVGGMSGTGDAATPPERFTTAATSNIAATAGASSAPGNSGAVDVSPPVQDAYAQFRLAKDFMNNAVVNSLGIKGFFFTLKLERAGSVADLRELVKPFQEAIIKASGEADAKVIVKQLLELLK